MTTSARTPTPGADPTAVGRWLARVLDDERWTDAEVTSIGAGRSNLTYRVSSPAGAVVLRRPPVGSVAATAHDMGREQRVISALGPTAVPVPAVLATYAGPEGDAGGADGPTDAPCFVMELVDGVVPLGELPDGWATGERERRAAGEALVQVLAALHAVDPQEVGLGDFGRPEGFMERQIRRWGKQWAAARDGDDPIPVAAEDESELTRLSERLAADVPPAQRHTIVHGDYRLDNCVFDVSDPGRIAAVLDWEMSTLGDPLADLGLLLVYWQQDGDDPVWSQAQPLSSPTALPGFPTRRELVTAYADRTGLDVTPLPWYVAFGAFKLAVVLAGILARVRAGAVPAEMAEGLDGSVGPLVALGHHMLDGGSF
ncbi:Predicted kinase, aminoglycoside phosphotransferase (APT) family [Pseudonocardia ammonioxydans]|uniref:Predicted kinase, aminoglycoside phosphotransferase (APT) family n=1 Tax=Pseudonocardia ammonioxydans TaxID=260086 RepID=A0A1I4VHP9_PSUAM|nr:phosphotransferase family protein [Pseudonocardia ammonioxydans]SFN00731.1 Predicted kinase, aminoglycoside phosphotransferase (APT) family [Pseudonocardia ammonioxydans]